MEVRRSNNELLHFGVKGQKWGKRRYQNPDGSLTPEGRAHYGLNTKSGREAIINSGDVKKVKAVQKELTTEELNKAVNRIRLNDQLNSYDRSTLSKGEQWIKTHKDTILTVTSVVGAVTTAGITVGKGVNKLRGKESEVEKWQNRAKIAAAKQTVAKAHDYLEENGWLDEIKKK